MKRVAIYVRFSTTAQILGSVLGFETGVVAGRRQGRDCAGTEVCRPRKETGCGKLQADVKKDALAATRDQRIELPKDFETTQRRVAIPGGFVGVDAWCAESEQ